MKAQLVITFFTIWGISNGQAPSWQWAHSGHGPLHDYGNSISTDGHGNCYATGNYQAPFIVFGNDTIASNTGFYLVKYDSLGNVLWSRSAGGQTGSSGSCVSTDINGNSYVTGYFNGADTLKFDNISLVAGGGGNEVFVAKFDSAGNALWAKTAGTTAETSAYNGIDGDGNVYVVANFTADSSLVKNFVKKYDGSGNLLWESNVSGNYNTPNICTDINGNSYVTGTFMGSTMTFGTDTVLNTSAGYIIFVVKYDHTGNVDWAISDGTYPSQYVPSISTDGNGNCVVTGYFNGNFAQFGNVLLTNAGFTDIFIVKYGFTGNLEWAKRAGGASDDQAYNIKTDATGNSYMTGIFKSLSTFGSINLFSAGGTDVFAAKYDSSGNALWAQKAGGINPDAGNGIAIDANGNSYVTGIYFSPYMHFGSFTEINCDTISNPAEVFIAKLNDIPTAIDEMNLSEGVQVFPNPFSVQTTIYTDRILKNASMIVYNSVGEQVKQLRNISGKTIRFYRDKLAAGVYSFCLLQDDKTLMAHKLVMIDN